MRRPGEQGYIKYDRVSVKYTDQVFGLSDVDLSIARGEFVFFVGKTGAGKSTMLRLLTREAKATSGRITLEGRDVGTIPPKEVFALRRQLGVVPQDFALLPGKKVWENVAYAMRAVGATKREIRRRVPEILERVNIGHRADAFPRQLSGGEQQRVAIARALINDPKLIIADEPTGNLDPQHSWEIIEIFRKLNEQGATVLVASHDLIVVSRSNARIVTLDKHRILEDSGPITQAIDTQMQLKLDEEHHVQPSPSQEDPGSPETPEDLERADV